jgi:hypothetical protein
VQKSIDNLVAAKNIRDKKMQEMKDKQAFITLSVYTSLSAQQLPPTCSPRGQLDFARLD